jgi:hypothetical protein
VAADNSSNVTVTYDKDRREVAVIGPCPPGSDIEKLRDFVSVNGGGSVLSKKTSEAEPHPPYTISRIAVEEVEDIMRCSKVSETTQRLVIDTVKAAYRTKAASPQSGSDPEP